jgi:hypothetical protein
MLVAGRDFSEEILARIRSRVEGDPTLTRTALSREVCGWLGWQGADGQPKDMSCRVALLKIARRGVIELPAGQAVTFAKSAEASAPAPRDWLAIEAKLAELGRVDLVPVDSGQAEMSNTWWAMMQAHHPLGAGPLCGAQLRYLVACEAGIVGGLSFSAPAWRLAPRDAWIGWDDQTRQAGLSKVVANSRFLILPGVCVPNLASHVLSLALARLASDWQSRYGIAPVLVETFVDRSRYRGTCYRAANWKLIGQTQGRGRQDRRHAAEKAIKDIWVYPLQSHWQTILQANGGPALPHRPANLSRAPIVPADWAEEEFGDCALPDARLQTRLLSLVRDFYARPTANVAQACASRAKTKAAYRFLDHDKTTMDTLLAPHILATEGRVHAESIVLAVQDTTSLNYTAHAATEGMGPIGSTVNGPQGLHLHSTLAFSTQGTPLGFLDVQCWSRDPAGFGKKAQRHRVPIEEKESFKWLKSFRAVAAVQARCPDTTLVSVGDREADLYELFEEALAQPNGPKLLVRAKHDRQLQDEQQRLWETMQSRPVAGIQVLQVPRQGSRAAREAHMTIRHADVSLAAPAGHKGTPIPVWAVLAQEQDAPAGVKPLEWMLLTTVPVTCIEQATEKLMWYARRWGIEVLHRTLKSGCRIEQRQLGQADRIEACLAIDLVVAWRIYYLNKLGREVPQAPCTVYFEEAEWKALMVFTTDNHVAPARPPTLREAIRRVATLGGFLGRKSDGEPGTQTLWIGLQRLDDIVTMWRFMNGATQMPVSSRLDSG